MRQRRWQAIAWLTVAGMLMAGAQALTAAQDRPAAPAGPSAAEQQDITALTQAVDAASAGKVAGDSPLTWLGHHFIRSQRDSVYVPFSLSIDRRQFPGGTATVYIRAISHAPPAAGAQKFAWEALQPVEVPADGQLARALVLTPGTYDVFVAVKEKGAAAPVRVAVVQHELSVPSLAGPDLAISSVILARAVEQLPAPLAADKQQDNPYVIGTYKVTPSPDAAFAKNGMLFLVFWIYHSSESGGKPDVQVDFSFHRRLPEGETYFNRTNPQELSAKTLPAEFNLNVGHQLSTSLSIPLASFPAGDYRLEIKVTDKPSGKSLTSNVNFAVAAS